MGRRPRVEYEGAIYHVIQRGNNKEYIFADPNYKKYFLNQLQQTVRFNGIKIYAYVVMNNHYHVAMQTNQDPLSKIMHRINTRFSHYYNKTQQRTGHVFENRYKSILIKDERYLLSVVRYIHCNPVRAKICLNVSNYKWSSDRYYRTEEVGFVDSNFVLGLYGSNKEKAIIEYIRFMNNEENTDSIPNSEADKFNGESHFKEEKEFERPAPVRMELDEILMGTGVDNNGFNLIKQSSRKRCLTQYKAAYAREALKQGYTMKEIGNHIGVSDVAINKLVPGT